jgi:transposase
MVLDQAGWHDSRALSVPANVTLVPLPSYSPELNPVERVWLHRFLSHRLHDDCEAIVAHRRGRPHQIALHLPVDPEGQDLGSMV